MIQLTPGKQFLAKGEVLEYVKTVETGAYFKLQSSNAVGFRVELKGATRNGESIEGLVALTENLIYNGLITLKEI